MKEFSEWVLQNFGRAESLLAYAFVVVVSLFSSTIGHLYRLRTGPEFVKFSWPDLALDLLSSGLVGIVVFWLTINQGMHPGIAAVCIAIAGHMGARAIGVGTQLFKARTKPFLNHIEEAWPKHENGDK